MQALKKNFLKYLPAATIFLLCGVFVLYAVAVALAGGSVLGLFLYPLAFFAAVLLPGLWLCSILLPRASCAEKAALALPLGGLLLVFAFCILGWFLPAWFCVLPCAILGCVFFAKKFGAFFSFSRFAAALQSGPNLCLVLLFAAGLFLFVWLGVFSAAKPENAGNMVYSQDVLWSIGNANAANFGMPVRDLRTASGILHYHYMSDILCGLVASFSLQSGWDAVAFYNWPFFFAGLLLALFAVCRRFGASGFAVLPPVAGALFAHFAWDASIKHIFQNPNGVLQSYQYLAAAVLVLQIGGDGQKNRRSLAAFLAVICALMFSKSTVGLLFLCAVLAAFAAGALLQKKMDTWLLAAGSFGLCIFFLLYIFLYRGAINNLVFKPSTAALADALRIMLAMYLPGFILYLISAQNSLRNFKALSPASLAVNALVLGGILAYVLFYHYSFSQSYFLLCACFAMWMCIAPLANKLAKPKLLLCFTALLLFVGVFTSLFYAAPSLRHGAQVALRCAALRPALPQKVESATKDDAAAAAWLLQNMGKEDVFATNRNAQNPLVAEGVFHYYTAASGRQAFVESWRYGMDYSMDYKTLRHNLETVSDGIFAAQNWQNARQIAKENGISYLLLHLPSGGRAFDGAKPVFASPTVIVYKV